MGYSVWADASSTNSLRYQYQSSISGAARVQYELVSLSPSSLASIESAAAIMGYYQTQYLLAFLQSGSSSTVAVEYSFGNGTAGSVTAGSGIWIDAATGSIEFTYPAIVQGSSSGTRYSLTGVDASSPLSIAGPTEVTGTYVTQYLLTVATSPSGLNNSSHVISPSSGYYDAGTVVTLTAGTVSGYSFANWVVDGTAQTLLANTTVVMMDGPHSATAVYESPTGGVQSLTSTVNSMTLQQGTQSSLDSKLNSALSSLNTGNNRAAVNQLNAFINEVNAQTGKQLSSSQAELLVAYAQEIIQSIG